MSIREILQALLDGEKLTKPRWDYAEYIYMLPSGQIVDETIAKYEFTFYDDWYLWCLWKESKPHITWYRAKLYSYKDEAIYHKGTSWHSSKESAQKFLGYFTNVVEWETMEAPKL